MKEMYINKVYDKHWEVWKKGDEFSDDLNKRGTLKSVGELLDEQPIGTILVIRRKKNESTN